MLTEMDFNAALGNAQLELDSGAGLERILAELRNRGADKIDSIRIVKTAMKISMGQAKSLVDRSEVWNDRYEHDRAMHESARQAVEELKKAGDGIEVIMEERSADPD